MLKKVCIFKFLIGPEFFAQVKIITLEIKDFFIAKPTPVHRNKGNKTYKPR